MMETDEKAHKNTHADPVRVVFVQVTARNTPKTWNSNSLEKCVYFHWNMRTLLSQLVGFACVPISLSLSASIGARLFLIQAILLSHTVDHSLLFFACGGGGFAQHTMQRCRFLWTMLNISVALLCFVFIWFGIFISFSSSFHVLINTCV